MIVDTHEWYISANCQLVISVNNYVISFSVLWQVLTPPSSDSILRVWVCAPELSRVLAATGALLGYSDGHSEGPALLKAAAAVAETACSTTPPTWSAAVAVVEALKAAEAEAAKEKAAVGYAFVTFQECLLLCCALLAQCVLSSSSGPADEPGRWQLAGAVASCLTGIFARVQLCVSSKVRGPALRQAESVLSSVQSTASAAHLCCCIAEATAANSGAGRRSAGAAAAAAAAEALLVAMAALMHAPPGRANGCAVGDHFPLAQMLSAKIADTADQGIDSDANLLEVSLS